MKFYITKTSVGKIVIFYVYLSYNLIVRLGVGCMREMTRDRAVVLGEYILETGATVRATAKVFKISKSTVQTEVAIVEVLCG